MAETKLTASEKERYDIIRSCIEGDITNKEAGIQLGLKTRQVQNLKLIIEAEGERGAVHKSKGQAAGNITNDSVIKKVEKFFENKKHKDFGPTFANEKLALVGVQMSTETLRLLMVKKELWKAKKRRGHAIHREWRERMGSYGELVQFDGSYHDWFENGDEQCLLAAIDDATSLITKAVFEDNEGVLAVFRFWMAYVETYGRPIAIYLDKFSTYKVNHKNAVDNVELVTQFKRAMDELDINVICANSPEAKGRVERLFGTLQDRMVKEMRLVDVKSREMANQFLNENYILGHNQRYGHPARNEQDAHRPLTLELRTRLASIFSVQSKRKVNNDYTIQFKTEWFQLEDTQDTTLYKRDTVIIEERLDGTIYIRLKDVYLRYRRLPQRPKATHVTIPALTKQKPYREAPKNHPWRKFSFGKNSPKTENNNT